MFRRGGPPPVWDTETELHGVLDQDFSLAGDGRECLTNVSTLERNPEQLLFSPGEQPSLPEVDDLKQLLPLRRSQ